MQQAKKGPQLVRLKLLCFGYPGTQPAFSIVYFLSESSPVVRKQGAALREVGTQDEMGREKGREGILDSFPLFINPSFQDLALLATRCMKTTGDESD